MWKKDLLDNSTKYRQTMSPLFFSLTAKAKLKAVADYVEECLQEEETLVVFGHHKTMMDFIEERLKTIGVDHVRIDGQVPNFLRPALIAKFQDREVRVALVSITALGQGISLTAARRVVFAELHWVPGRLLQAEDRVHRPGQDQHVEVHYCIAEGGQYMDERIFAKLIKKDKVVKEILEGHKEGSQFENLRVKN